MNLDEAPTRRLLDEERQRIAGLAAVEGDLADPGVPGEVPVPEPPEPPATAEPSGTDDLAENRA